MTAKTKTILKDYFSSGGSDKNSISTIESEFENLIDTIGGSPALVVAANDASDSSKGRADYVCDGTADNVEIASALAALPDAGGTVTLSEGAFNLTAALTLPAKPVRLIGQGQFANLSASIATVLNFALSSSGACITFSDDIKSQEIERFAIDGDGANTTIGIQILGSSAFKVCKDILITNMVTYGVDTDSGSSQCYFEKVYAKNLATGFNLFSVANLYIGCQATRDSSTGVGGNQGFRVADTGSVLVGCVAERHWRGFELSQYATGLALIGCYSEKSELHLRVGSATPNEAKSITIAGFYGQDSDHAANAAVLIAQSFGTTIIGMHILNSTSNKAIEITSDASAVSIFGGYTDDTTPITDAGSSVTISNFYPYVGENSGAAASTADGGTIAHGCSATPSVAFVSASVAGEIATVTSIGASNITVAIKDNDDSAGTSQTIYWRAYV